MDHPALSAPLGLAVLGSTGSIGTQALDVAAALPAYLRVVALAAGSNIALLNDQIRTFRPELVCCAAGRDGIDPGGAAWATPEEIVTHANVDIVLIATTGRTGLMPTLAALRAGKTVALANKEVLVMAGALLRRLIAEHGGSLRPVDSEHSALWQCLWGEQPEDVSRLVLTASGGAFRDRPVETLADVTPEEALRHPTWRMGRKVTIDSATLLNKGLEAIEARWLFDVPLERIDIVLHRESIVHSLVEFADGSFKAQLAVPDMRLPIQLALTYPHRLPLRGLSPLDLAALGTLHFDPLDLDRVPCLRLALEAGRRGGTYPAVLAAADEIAVERFLAGEIRFTEIAAVIADALDAHDPVADPDLDAILAADAWARERAARYPAVIVPARRPAALS